MNRKTVGVIAVAGIIGVGAVTTASGQSASTIEAADTVQGFFAAQQSSYVIPGRAKAAQTFFGSASQRTGFSAVIPVKDAPNLPALKAPSVVELQQQNALGRASLSKHATNAALSRSVADHARTISGLAGADGFRALGGGADSVKIVSTQRTGSTLQVIAQVKVWSMFAERQPSGVFAIARPENILDVKATLVSSDRGLLVSDYTWSFAPGSAP